MERREGQTGEDTNSNINSVEKRRIGTFTYFQLEELVCNMQYACTLSVEMHWRKPLSYSHRDTHILEVTARENWIAARYIYYDGDNIRLQHANTREHWIWYEKLFVCRLLNTPRDYYYYYFSYKYFCSVISSDNLFFHFVWNEQHCDGSARIPISR